MATLLEIYATPSLLSTIPPDRQSLQGDAPNGSGTNPIITPYKPNGAYGFGDIDESSPAAFDNPNTYSDQGFGQTLLSITGNDAVHF